MTQVLLGLDLDLTPFNLKIGTASSEIDTLRNKARAGVTLRTFLDTSTLTQQLAAAQKMLSGGNTRIKVGTDLYKKGSQYSISKTKVKKEIIDKIQDEIRDDRDYKIKIGAELDYNPAAIKKQLESSIGTVSIKVDAELVIDTAAITRQIQQAVRLARNAALTDTGTTPPPASRQPRATATTAATQQPDAAVVRQLVNDAITKTPRKGGFNSGDIEKVAAQARQAGAQITATTVTELRKELPSALAQVADDAILGLAKGLVSNDSVLSDASKKTAESLIKALKKSLRIASPSGESRDEVGKPIGEGIGKGTIEGLVQWERRIAGAIRQTIGNVWKQGLARDAAARGALADMGRDAAQVLSSSLSENLKQNLGSAIVPALKGALVGGAGGGITGMLVGAGSAGMEATGQISQRIASGGLMGALRVASGDTSAITGFIQESFQQIVQQALGSGLEGALIGGAGVAAIAGGAGLVKNSGGALAKQLLAALQQQILGVAVTELERQATGVESGSSQGLLGGARRAIGLLSGNVEKVANDFGALIQSSPIQQVRVRLIQVVEALRIAGAVINELSKRLQGTSGGGLAIPGSFTEVRDLGNTKYLPKPNEVYNRIIKESLDVFNRAIDEQTRIAAQANAVLNAKTAIRAVNVSDYTGFSGRTAPALGGSTLGGIPALPSFGQTGGGYVPPSGGGRPPQRPPGPTNRFDGIFGGQLALRSIPVEFFTSFRDAERLLALVERRLAAVAKAFDTLKVKSQLQADQGIRQLEVSLRAVLLAFQKGEVGAEDVRAALYGLNREMAGLAGQTAQVQNLAQAFENLGGMSAQARQAIENQRNEDVKYIQSETARGRDRDGNLILSQEGRRAGNLRDIQQLTYANDLVRGSQSASGFGGFRGREIGNDTLIKALQRTNLSEYLNQFDQLSSTILETSRNTKVYNQVQAALSEEFDNASRALRVLNGEAKAGETLTQVARNAWGTILDDFQNLVPQLLVFAVAYNLILQRVLTTPGAVIQAAAAFERLETSISSFLSATRGIGDASGVINELRGVALDLGIGFEKAASSYLRFAAATQGTPLEGREVDITRTVATAGRNQGLSGEQIDRASVALTQILSKGRVQSEELRGQLAEQLPGALQIAARAFGVTTKELYRMVEAGQIAGDEFVGKFIGQLKAEGASTNQLAGSFSNVTEQLGSSVQALAATAGQPFLTPLTLALQGVNAVIQALIPVTPLLTGLVALLGAAALRTALGNVSLRKEIVGVTLSMLQGAATAIGYTAGMNKATIAARTLGTSLAFLGKAAVVGLVFEGFSLVVKALKGELGKLGDEAKKVQSILSKGPGESSLSTWQKAAAFFNAPFRYADEGATVNQSAEVGKGIQKATRNILANNDKIKKSVADILAEEKRLFDLRNQSAAEQDPAKQAALAKEIKASTEEIERIKREMPEGTAQVPALLTATRASIQALDEQIKYKEQLDENTEAEEKNKKILEERAVTLERVSKQLGLLGQSFKANTLQGFQAELKRIQDQLATEDVNSPRFKELQLQALGLQKAVEDIPVTAQERSLKTQEATLRRMSAELKVQENIQRIKLSLIENERKQLEAAADLERTRGQLREAVAQRRVSIASALNAPEERLAAEAQLQQVRERNQARDLQMQSQILNKDRERINAETNLQKEQLKIQTQQLRIDLASLQIEKIRLENALKVKGIKAEQKKQYQDELQILNQTIGASNQLIGQEGSLLQSIQASGSAQLSVLGIRQDQLDVQQRIVKAEGLTERQILQIESAKQQILDKEQAALNVLENAKSIYGQLEESIQGQLEGVRALVQAELERSKLAEEAAGNELAVVDRLLDLQQGRNEGGFFERMAKASLLGASSEQDAYNLAQRRLELQQQIQQQQIRQKRLELNLKREELRAEEALNALKLKGLRIENEAEKVQARRMLEQERLKLVMLGDKATPEQKRLLGQINDLFSPQKLGGYNPTLADGGNSQNVAINDAVARGRLAVQRSGYLDEQEAQNSILVRERTAGLQRSNEAQETELQLQERLFRLDAAQWFGQFLDKTTQLGRTLGVITTGLSEFRSTVSQAFSDAITNGADASEAIADAGKALAGKFVTGLIDELFLKPMEENFFRGIQQLFPDLFKNEQQSLVDSTNLNTSSTDTLTQVNRELINTINKLPDLTKRIDATIPRPTMETPVYRAPENPGLASSIGGNAFSETQKDYYIDQLESASGAGWRECYSAVAAMLASTYKDQQIGLNEYNRIRARFGDSTSSAAQLKALRELGLNATVSDTGSIEQVREMLRSGKPVGLGINHNNRSGHWIMAHGLTPNGDFIVDDPYGKLNQRRNTGWAATNSASRKPGNNAVYSADFLRSIFEDRGPGTGRILRIEGMPKVGTGSPSTAGVSQTVLNENAARWAQAISSRLFEGADYNTKFGGGSFDNKKPHPGGMTPYGRYQFQGPSWMDANGGRNLPMTPENQDRAFLALGQRRGVNFMTDAPSAATFAKLRNEWTSVPGAAEARGTMEDFMRAFRAPLNANVAPTSQPLPPAVMTPLPGVGGAPPSASNPVPVTVIPLGGSPATLDQAGAMLGNQVPQLDPATAVNWSTLGQNADVASQTLADTTVVTQDAITSVTGLGDSFWAAAGGMDSIATAATNTPNAFMSLNNTISGVVGVLGSLGVGIAGYQQLKKGGTYNTLMGLAGIFGSIGSITGMFTNGGIFGGGRASGGPVKARTPYLVGEQGPELFMSAVDGQILNNGDTQDYFKQTRASLGRVTTRDRDSRSAALPPMAPIDIRYESQTINNVEYVTAEQHRKGMEMAARRGQQLAYQGLQNSVKVRRRLGVS